MTEHIRGKIIEEAGFPNPEKTEFEVEGEAPKVTVAVLFNPGGEPWHRVVAEGESEPSATLALLDYMRDEHDGYVNLCAKAADPDALWR
jgi:hypothetical protein